MYLSHDEIFLQGASLRRTYTHLSELRETITEMLEPGRFDEIVFIACGSSYWGSMSAAMTLREQIGTPCTAVKSGDVIMNPDQYQHRFTRPLVIAPSRSGLTAETVAALERFREWYGCPVLSIVEISESKVPALSELTIELPWAPEESVCQTRSFSNLYLSMVMIAAFAGRDEALLSDLGRYIDEFDGLSRTAERQVTEIATSFEEWSSTVALGHGKQYGAVIEGAYIAIEMAQAPAHYFGTLEWRHGPIVLSDESYLVCITSGTRTARPYEEGIAVDTQKTGARVLAIGAHDTLDHSNYQLSLGWDAAPETIALYSTLVMQGLAYHQALLRGLNPDAPGSLTPWIAL